MLLGRGTAVPPDADVLDLSIAAEKPKILARKANQKAYNLLELSCTDPVSATAVLQVKTTDLPNGDARQHGKLWNGFISW